MAFSKQLRKAVITLDLVSYAVKNKTFQWCFQSLTYTLQQMIDFFSRKYLC